MIRIALTALALSVVGTAQAKLYGGNDEPRAAATKLILDEGQGYKMLGAACIQYGQPEWKAEYDSMVEGQKGKSWRLGKNFWTTLNTSTNLTIGGVNVAAGQYYLGLHYDQKGEFHLLVIDSKTADKSAWTPWMANEWKATYTCPMKHGKSTTTTEKLAIHMTGESQAAMELKIAWGGHTLTAPMAMTTTTTAAAVKDAAVKAVDTIKTEAAEIKKVPETVKK